MALTQQDIRQITDEIVRSLSGALKTAAPVDAGTGGRRWLCETAQEAVENARRARRSLPR
jgi:hypothetical protein